MQKKKMDRCLTPPNWGHFLWKDLTLTTCGCGAHRYGTDVYLHLNRLSSSSEPLQ